MRKNASKRKKLLLKITVLLLILIVILSVLFSLFYFGVFSNLSKVKFDPDKLRFANAEIETFDINNNLIRNKKNERQIINLENLNKYTIDSFVSIEDKNFYKHNGINYKRIIKAFLNNIKSKTLKEGASTISQQLIKNTHLTNEKTISRKLNELLLTQKLEKNFSKDEILQAYLNVIYFGSGTFGLEQASQKYFSKSANELSLAESATLAGLIKSPKKYSPINNPTEAIRRRNVVLEQLYIDNKITISEYDDAKKQELILNINTNATGNNTYYSAAINEACDLLNISEKDLILDEYKIYTYLNNDIQENLVNAINDKNLNPKTNTNDSLGIIIDNKTGGILAYFGKSKFNLQNIKRQPGSTLKPIIAYAPALEKNLITPSTPILDEKFTIENYTPKNYKEKYYGWTTIKNSLAKSLNVPAVKVLSYVGINNAKSFASKIGINLDVEDNGYSIALGGLTKGVTPLEIANSYQTIANNGKYQKATFIKKIVNKYGRIVYKNNEFPKKVLRADSSFLLTNMLIETSKNGTGKKLSDLPFSIASKTGTVGSKHLTNTDIWNLSYTTDHTVCVWLGNTSENIKNNFAENETGASYPTNIAKKIYQNLTPKIKDFKKPDSVVEKEISTIDLENNLLCLANENTPKRFKKMELFSNLNLPKSTTKYFSKNTNTKEFCIVGSCINHDKISIIFTPKPFYFYDIIRKCENKKEIIKSFSNKSNEIVFIDDNPPLNTICEYYVIEKFKDENYLNLNESNYTISNVFKTYIIK